LKKIDPTFSGKDVDPQDVKAIFHPVEYVVFHGLCSVGVQTIEFVSRAPTNRNQEVLVRSIDSVVRNGDVEFETLRMDGDGSFEIEKN
jgi:predicted Holliday junction resolvase-like endonuclease